MSYFIIFLVLIIIAIVLFNKKKSSTESVTLKNVSTEKNVSTKKSLIEKEWDKWKNSFDPENSSEIFKTFNTKIVGVTYQNKDGSSRQNIISKCRLNEKLILIPEIYKENYAIMVCRENFEQLGYLNSVLAEEISDLMVRRKSRVDAKISTLTGGNGKTRGVNVEIIKYLTKKRPKQPKKAEIIEKPYDPNIKMHRLSFERQFQAVELEKQGFIENAIELFQSIINDKKLQSNDSTLPYSRLLIIYRKRKDYDSEIEIIEKYKEMFEKSMRNDERKQEELAKLDRRLKTVKNLKQKK